MTLCDFFISLGRISCVDTQVATADEDDDESEEQPSKLVYSLILSSISFLQSFRWNVFSDFPLRYIKKKKN